MYTAKFNIKSSVRNYKRGETLGKEFKEESLKRLLKMGVVFKNAEEPVKEIPFAEPNELYPEFLSEDKIRSFRTKDDIISYAENIGLSLDNKNTKEELINSVINYIDELSDINDI